MISINQFFACFIWLVVLKGERRLGLVTRPTTGSELVGLPAYRVDILEHALVPPEDDRPSRHRP